MVVRVVYLKELKKYSKNSLFGLLGIDEKRFNKIETDLLRKRILKEDKNLYSFEYVGIIFSNELLLVILPKISTGLQELDYTNLVLKVLKKYENTKKLNYESGDFFLKLNRESESQFISIVEYLLRDFIEYGLFHSEKFQLKKDDGEIDWDYTLSKVLPLKINGKFRYTDTYTRKKKLEEDNFIRKLHMIVLNMCSKYLKNLREFEIYKKYPILDYEVEEDILEKKEFIFFELDRALKNEFNDRNINLISAIKIFFLKNNNFQSYQELSFYGVRKFQTVWEEVCSKIHGNEIDILNIMEKMAEESTPIWTVGNNENKFWKNNQHYKPDIVIKSEKNKIKLYDAKYYPIKIKNKKFENIPDLEDVSKQFLYENILRLYYPKEKFENIFLFPSNEKSLMVKAGKVEMKMFLEKYIEIALVDFQMALENYIKQV